MAEAGGPSLLDLAPPSGHGDVFHMITGNLRLQDLQAPAYCYHRFTSEDLEVGSGLVPLHPALGSPDVRQALVAQQRLHSSIFGGSGWRTEDLGDHPAQFTTPDSTFKLVAYSGLSPAGDTVTDFYVSSYKAFHARDSADSLRVPVPELAGRGMCAEWASDSTHVAAAFAPHVQQPGTVQLLIIRMAVRAHRHYAMEQLTEANPSGFLELRWAPCLSAGGRPRLAVISRAQSSQVRRVCPRFAHLKSSGVEVVHLRAEGSVLNSTMWSPDGETVLSVMCSTSPDPTNGSLLLTSVATGHQRIVVLPKAPVLPHCICWTPDSRLLISVTGAHACFVDKQTCATRLQRLSLPQRLCVHRAMCSRAGLVVVAHFGAQYGVFSVFSLVGAPKRLQELRQISTGRMAASLALSPSGLLLTWVDFGSRLQPAPLEGLLVQAMPCVHVCELATGRAAMLCKKPKVELTWLPIPTNAVSYAYGQDAYAGLGLFWASSGTELCISGPYNGISPTMPVQRMCLLP